MAQWNRVRPVGVGSISTKAREEKVSVVGREALILTFSSFNGVTMVRH